MKLFSERYKYTKASDVIIREAITPEIQNAICSCFDRLPSIFVQCNFFESENSCIEIEKYLWTKFLNKREGNFVDKYNRYHIVSTTFLEDDHEPWYRKLDLVECVIKHFDSLGFRYVQYSRVLNMFVTQLNSEFERLNFAYRIVNNEIVEITSKEELAAIESSMQNSSSNIKMHLRKALELYAQRPNGDYCNSIKESISAVEAYCREITGENKLGPALSKLESKGVIVPKVLIEAFHKLYAYTNQHDTGIRHALMDEDETYTPGAEEALFMLVSCSAFINYLNKKIK